jgi:hypothetical protein
VIELISYPGPQEYEATTPFIDLASHVANCARPAYGSMLESPTSSSATRMLAVLGAPSKRQRQMGLLADVLGRNAVDGYAEISSQ